MVKPLTASRINPIQQLLSWSPAIRLLPWLVVIVSLAVTHQLWKNAQYEAVRELQYNFNFRLLDVNNRIEQRMQSYEQALRGTQGLFAASISVERDEFHAYIIAQHIVENLPGIQGVGFSLILPTTKQDKHTASSKKNSPANPILLNGQQDITTSIAYIEPSSEGNRRTFGYDMYSDSVRRSAMEQARDTNKAIITGKTKLIQENSANAQAGFLMYLPIYKNGTPYATLAERRANLVGWAFALFRMNDLMRGILGTSISDIDMKIYDGAEMSSKTLMHTTDNTNRNEIKRDSLFHASKRLEIAGHTWTMAISSLPSFEAQLVKEKAQSIVVVGLAVSILLGLLTGLLVQGRERALRTTRKVNERLIESEERLRLSLMYGEIGTWDWDICTSKLYWCDHISVLMACPAGKQNGTDEDFLSSIHPDDRQHMINSMYSCVEENTKYNIEHRVIWPDGTVRWLHQRGGVIRDTDGSPLKMLGVVQDVTTKKLEEMELVEIDTRLRTIIDAAPDAVVLMNSNGILTGWNEQAEKIFGWTREETIGHMLHDLIIPPQYRDAHIQGLKHFLAFGKGAALNKRIEITGLHRDGHQFAIELAISPVKQKGKYEFCAFIHDITARKKTENLLLGAKEDAERSSAELISYIQAIDQHALVSVADPSGRIIQANDKFCEVSGYSREEILGHDHRIINSETHPSAFFVEMWATIASGDIWRGEICNRAKNGTLYWVDSTIVPLKGANGQIVRYISVRVDITKRKESEQHIQSLAYYDVLTGLPNRTLLHDRLGQLIAESHRDQQKFALLFIDLDRFKYVNDSMGHAVGDKLLQVVALRVRECVREVDTVSRISGDEFIVLLRETDAKGAARVAGKILQTLTIPCDVGTLQIATHASIGISIYPDNADSEDEINTLIKHADVAMYRVKAEGRSNFLFFAPEMNFRANQLFSMENDMRLALERNEFILHYQPQANLISGIVCGAEALLRWKHPEKGFVTPTEFIPVAEETGQIIPIGEWVLRTACAQLAEWRRQGMSIFPISINLSISQLRQPQLAQMIIAILEETGLHPKDLELEITEGVMMNEAQASMAFLAQMHELGVQLAIDDFGTGYSSLSYLKKMPLDRLKVDQSFVRDAATDENDAAIVRSIISLGHQFKLQVIAEGVETLEQLDFLRARGCDEIQGYYYSRPLPAEKFAIFINSNPLLN
ncbi:MAG: PAS domain S-box-containing protein/diguanylate cyclase (GGDEF) domain-containing protein [Candidatus Nitrotoga sp. SPKER]|nr:MAG: PAS domain S-box-containing protein/diguanylate cyclase (GGDEF) domain-containing protein [Candidatus Nitrotoga sp. SPKER]